MAEEKETLEQTAQDTDIQEPVDSNQDENLETNNDITDDSIDTDTLSDEDFVKFLDKEFGQNRDKVNVQTEEDQTESKIEEKTLTNEPKEYFTKSQKSTNNTTNEGSVPYSGKSTPKNVDYKAEYERVLKPFKANGKEITPKTIDDVISLMQMGANYTKKMQLLAPYKKAVETLNKHNIGEEDLSFLIDVYNGDQEAIKKLIKDKGIDLMEMDLEDIKYQKNKKNIASNEDVQFSDTLMDISSSIPRIQAIMDKDWDEESRRILLKDPNALRGLHEEIEMGRFDVIQPMVEREKTFGRFKGVPDIQIYSTLVNQYIKDQQSKQTNTQVESSKSKKVVSDKRKAAPTGKNTTKRSSNLTVKDILSMPEEEFLKLSERNLI